jgi:hypothetical protein
MYVDTPLMGKQDAVHVLKAGMMKTTKREFVVFVDFTT